MTDFASIDLMPTAAASIVIQPGVTQSFTLMKVQVLNVGASNAKLQLYRVPAGGAPGTNNQLVPAKVIAPGSNATILPLSGQVIENGKSLQMVCPTTNGKLVLSLSYASNTN